LRTAEENARRADLPSVRLRAFRSLAPNNNECDASIGRATASNAINLATGINIEAASNFIAPKPYQPFFHYSNKATPAVAMRLGFE
jgi:hypothetical protein